MANARRYPLTLAGARRYLSVLVGARRYVLAPLLAGAVAAAARRRDALSPSGAAGAAAVGAAIFGAGGVGGSALLLLFFGSSTALSRLSGAGAAPRRTLAQVLANGGAPAVLALWDHARPSGRLAAAYAGALAAANADTWATEIGSRSATAPRLITNGRRVPRGVSGAVTPLGTLASVGGAALLGGAHALLQRRAAAALAPTIAGVAGSLADSVLGATLQAVYTCDVCGRRTESRHHAHDMPAHDSGEPALTRVSGLPFMTNDAVNVCASLTGAAVGAWLSGRRDHEEGVRGLRPRKNPLFPPSPGGEGAGGCGD